MKALSSTLFLLGLCVGVAPSAHASVSFASGGVACGSSLCFSGGGVNVTATGFYATFTNVNTATPTLGTLATTSESQYNPYGLGVCNPGDAGYPACGTPPDHAMDNGGGAVDFVLLQLSVPLTSIQLTLSPFATLQDMDITVITGFCANLGGGNNCTPAGFLSSLVGTTPTATAINALFGTGTSNVSLTNYNMAGTSNVNRTVDLTGLGNGVNWILVGASTQSYYGDSGPYGTADYFKLNSLGGSGVPEPATFGLAGAALAAMAFLRRKKLTSIL